MAVLHYYMKPSTNVSFVERKFQKLREFDVVNNIEFEYCFNIRIEEEFFPQDVNKVKWILSDSVKRRNEYVKETTFLKVTSDNQFLVEIGPRLNFSTPFSTNAVSVCHSAGLIQITRVERSIRYLINSSIKLDDEMKQKITNALHDRMTECQYVNPISSFDHGVKPKPWYVVDVMNKGKKALAEINDDLGLALDDWDLEFYTELFRKKLKRNPTSVECFDLAQSNSEHSRHWFFKGLLNIDGTVIAESLFQIIMDTQKFSNQNNIIKFSDNSSAIEGFKIEKIKPRQTHEPSEFESEKNLQHLIFTAETHNFPTAVSPFSGAATGTGGRIRDVQAVGRGGHVIAGTVGYAVGNLFIPDYDLPWEDENLQYSSTFAKPLDIIIEASNGCSDYGNKFGEPVICGFTRSFSYVSDQRERIEYIKPILFSGGMGTLDDRFVVKEKPSKGMKVVKIGGPVYRIGVGGGSRSSTQVQGDDNVELDFGAVQRGDPEMEQKMNRVVRSCIESSENPIKCIHDQGAGGNGNVLKELVEPEGAVICCEAFELGDPTIDVLELWAAEYQENNGILCTDDGIVELKAIAHRERCPINVVGRVTNSGRIILTEKFSDYENIPTDESNMCSEKTFPVNLDLELVLGKVPRKEFKSTHQTVVFKPLALPSSLQTLEALNLVLRHLSVCSKRFLTNKVDRSVTGLVAQQQCVGPLQMPISDMAVTAISYLDQCGIATSIGEQPIKGVLNPAAGGRMSVAEAMSNLVFAKISSIKDVKCSGNWMWPAKLPGEGANLYDTCVAMCALMKSLGIAIDGGKDSLSMAARLDNQEIVKSPGTLVVSTYAPCPNINNVVTPDLKSSLSAANGVILFVDVSAGKTRLGGSVLAQCYKQLGQEVPDIENPVILKSAFEITQKLIGENKILSGHDISDGGIITTLIEMAIAGISGLKISLPKSNDILTTLFNEECGWIIECESHYVEDIITSFAEGNVTCLNIGYVEGHGMNSQVAIRVGEEEVLVIDLNTLCSVWEDTSYQIEKLQMNPLCAKQEYKSFQNRQQPNYQYNLKLNPSAGLSIQNIQVALIREEGLNGDREMAASLYMAGFVVWDCSMQDLLDEKITIERFRGIIFPGGFSYADVFGAAKGWAAAIIHNKKLYQQFNAFYERSDTFSFGVCNGCQLMSLIKWIGNEHGSKFSESEITLKANVSGRFESRFSSVKICQSPAIMLKGMENSVLGVWVAHGEGRFTFSSSEFADYLNERNCIALRYVDDRNVVTERYPFNPNGSPGGIAGICSADGRHLAMMPHPERCVKFWQWPYIPEKWRKIMNTSNSVDNSFSPWFQIFLNAFSWCIGDSSD